MRSSRVLLAIASVLVVSATPLAAQAAARVICMDGTKAAAGRGVCSGHGGPLRRRKADTRAEASAAKAAVMAEANAAKAAQKTEKRAAKSEAKRAATVRPGQRD